MRPFLAKEKSILKWEVDLSVSDKLLMVELLEQKPEVVEKAMAEAGYEAQPVDDLKNIFQFFS